MGLLKDVRVLRRCVPPHYVSEQDSHVLEIEGRLTCLRQIAGDLVAMLMPFSYRLLGCALRGPLGMTTSHHDVR
jgi:hypothetical protein